MANKLVITRVTDENLLRARIYLQCKKCGHRFEHYTQLFDQKDTVRCPKCRSTAAEDETVILD